MSSKVYEDPRVSVNLLTKYIHSTPSQQEKILRDAKYPSAFITARYTFVREAVTRFLTTEPQNLSILSDKMELLKSRLKDPLLSDWEKQDLSLSLDAIQEFSVSHNSMNLNKFKFNSADHRGLKMDIHGVEVNIRPDLIIPPHGKNSKVGAVFLRPQKGEKSKEKREETGKTTASLLHYFLTETESADKKVDCKSCLVVDVSFGEVHHAPTTYKRRIGDIEAACRTIAAVWDDV